MNKSRIFVIMMISFATGVLLASRFVIPAFFIAPVIILTVIVLAVGYVFTRFTLAALIAACILFCAIGAWRLQQAQLANQFGPSLGNKIQLDGIVMGDIDMRTDRQQVSLQPFGYDQRILIITDKNRRLQYGDRLVVNGKLAEPNSSDDFDYAAYLRRFNTHGIMYYPKLLHIQANQGHIITERLLQVKYLFIKQINNVMTEIESNLLLGILIGARKGLPEQVLENFNITGTSHIIAISGYNISVIIGALAFLMRYIGRRLTMFCTIAVVAGFVIMSGASSSVVRAALMGGLFLAASHAGRLYAVTPSLCLTAVVMLIWNPLILYWDASFQLSFLATAGIVYLVPPLEAITERLPGLFGIKSMLLTTLSAIVATLPLILHSFGRLSIVAPVVNILVLPIVPITMLLGFLSAVPVVGTGFGFVAHLLLQYILRVTDFFAHIPYSSAQLHLGTQAVIGSYIALGAVTVFLHYRTFRGSSNVVQ